MYSEFAKGHAHAAAVGAAADERRGGETSLTSESPANDRSANGHLDAMMRRWQR
jgi:hypothetical protein